MGFNGIITRTLIVRLDCLTCLHMKRPASFSLPTSNVGRFKTRTTSTSLEIHECQFEKNVQYLLCQPCNKIVVFRETWFFKNKMPQSILNPSRSELYYFSLKVLTITFYTGYNSRNRLQFKTKLLLSLLYCTTITIKYFGKIFTSESVPKFKVYGVYVGIFPQYFD